MKTFNLSADYILWAHGPGAEDGQRLANELCQLAERPKLDRIGARGEVLR